MKERFFDRPGVKPLISYLVVILVFGVIWFIMGTINLKGSERAWNNGKCPKCGEELKFDSAVGHAFSTGFVYHCENCDYVIELSGPKNKQD